MSGRALVLALWWSGTTLLLAQTTWASRPPLGARIVRYLPGGWRRAASPRPIGGGMLRDVLHPVAETVGVRLASGLGLGDGLGLLLERVHSTRSTTEVRVRQGATVAMVFVCSCAAMVLLSPPLPLVVFGLAVPPLSAFFAEEHRLRVASDRWQRRVLLELPTVCEHLGMLLAAGYSLGSAIHRFAERGDGACAQDLARCTLRMRQGLSEHQALGEWAAIVQVPAVDRLVAVLQLDQEAGDLGGLIAEEARAIRAEVHRQVTAEVQTRAQQVWIPVTVATLVPGTIFLAVPYLDALRSFTRR